MRPAPNPPPGHPALWLLGLNLAMWGSLFGIEAIVTQRRGANPAITLKPSPTLPLPPGFPAPEALNPAQAPPVQTQQTWFASPSATAIHSGSHDTTAIAHRGATAEAIPHQDVWAPPLPTPLEGADALGGEISLASLGEPAMQPAARLERLRWQRSGNPLAALPLHWQQRLQGETAGSAPIQRAEMVRLPVAQLAQREEVALLIDDSGTATGLDSPRQEAARQAIETWASQQQPAKPGQVHAVVVAAEPLPPEIQVPIQSESAAESGV